MLVYRWYSRSYSSNGFTMVEIMVVSALTVICLLSFFRTQNEMLTEYRNINSVVYANSLVNAIMERMRSNPGIVPTDPGEPSDAFYHGYDSASFSADPTCIDGSYCSPSELADYDLMWWTSAFRDTGNQNVNPVLPNAIATIAWINDSSNPMNGHYRISIDWNESTWDTANLGQRKGTSETLTVYFKP